jgi:type I restriction enzyme S subunit
LLDDLAQGGVERLQDLVTLQGGGTPSRANPFYWKGSIPWIRPQNMKTREIKDSTDRITQEAIRNSSAKLLPAGAVLVVVRGMILAHTVPAAVLRVPAAVNQDMKALIPAEGLAPEYLNTSLWALNRRLLSFVERSTHGTCRLRTQDLLDFTIPVPPLAEQHRLVATLDGLRDWVDELTASQDATQAELDALLPSILDQAFKGEL